MADWEEIKRLAADLQRAQLSGSAQRYVSLFMLILTTVDAPVITRTRDTLHN